MNIHSIMLAVMSTDYAMGKKVNMAINQTPGAIIQAEDEASSDLRSSNKG